MSKVARELKNFFAVFADLASGAEEWSSRPAWLEFAPNNICNLRCIMCAQADGVPVEVMKKEDAVKLLDGVLPHTTRGRRPRCRSRCSRTSSSSSRSAASTKCS